MKPFIRPVLLDETSMRINLLHKALVTLGFPVDDAEVKSHTAGKSTEEQVRAFQAKYNVRFDKQYLVDQTTYDALTKAMIEGGHVDKGKTFVVSGTVYNKKGDKVKYQKLVVVDVDLKGAAVYKSVKSEKDLLDNGFEYLRARKSDANGNYYIEFYEMQYKNAERKKADIVVYAVDEKREIIGRSRMVNSEDYSAEGIVTDLIVVVTIESDRTEYDILMGKLNPFLEESEVKLIGLAKSADQVQFLSRELDLAQGKIQLAIDAENLIEQCAEQLRNNKQTNARSRKVNIEKYQDISKSIAHELLYGIGSQKIPLNWFILYRKTDSELMQVIRKSIENKIIQQFDEKIISPVLEQLRQCAGIYVLTYQETEKSPSLQKLLSVGLPETDQQVAFVDAFSKFKNNIPKDETIDYNKFWKDYLPSQEIFKNNPKLIPAVLLSQQLTILSGNHQQLVEELQVNRKISSVAELVAFDDNEWEKIIKKTGVPDFVKGENEKEKITNYSRQVQSFLNAAHPTRKIESMLNKQAFPIKNVDVASGIRAFLSENKEFDIGKTPVHEFAEELKRSAKENYNEAKKELNRMQRVFQVSPTPAVMVTLMEKNLNSAYAITSYAKKNFIKTFSVSLGGETMAEAVYQRAEHVSTLAAERAMKMYDLSHLAAPVTAYSDADRKKVNQLLQDQVSKRHNPNYSEIFGSPDICECDHCKSIYGAAAYFIDLLRFLEKGGLNSNGKSPLDMFKLRRPDLLDLPLTCENTNTLIPYIDLVNEVMEYYTSHGTMDNTLSSSAAYDTGDATADELRANPQNFVLDAYKKLKDAVYPFSLPYHQPLDVIRTYSDHLKTERYEVMHEMQIDFSPPVTMAIEAEALKISQEEFVVLTGRKYDLTPDTKQLHEYYGYSVAGDVEKLAGTGIADGIHEFLRRAGIKYVELVELLKTQFINPHQNLLDYLQMLFVNSTMTASTIYSKLQQINAGALNSAADADIMSVLTSASIAPADFDAWVQEKFADFNSVITLYQSDSLCDLNTTYLRTIQNIYAGALTSGISNPTWSKFHRFIRLWRKIGWTIHETDLVLRALGETDITEATISKLCYVVRLNKQLKLPVNKLATLWGSIDTYGDKSLYKKLFLNKAVQRIDDAFEVDEFGNYLTDSTQVLKDTNLIPPVDHVPAILAAFRMSEDDLSAILDVARIDDNSVVRAINLATDKLNIYNLSVIYRYTVLSKALKVKVPELCLLIKLFNIEPFSILTIPAPAVPPPDPSFAGISPSTTLDFFKLIMSVKKSGFKGELLQYIFNGTLSLESKIGLDIEKAKQSVRNIRETLAAIEQNYHSVPTTPLSVELLRTHLLLTFNADSVNHLMGIIENRQTFSVNTDPGLAIVIPGPLNAKYSYNNVSGEVKSLAIMSEADRTALKALTVNSNFQNAIDSLYALTKSLVLGAPTYSAITNISLPVIIPDSLSPKFTYNPTSRRLSCIGVMSDIEKVELKGLAGVDINFQDLVDAIYKMPEEFIVNNFSGVFASVNSVTPNSDIKTLLNHPSQPVEKTIDEKLQFVYENYLPLLKQKLREDGTIHHIASLIGLSNEATQVIMKTELNGLIDSIASEGFSGEYFSDAAWTTSVLKRTDSVIDFDWGPNSPDFGSMPSVIPADNFSARWQSYLSPAANGVYTLIVDVEEADETFKLYVDENLVLEKTVVDTAISYPVTAQLNASQLHKVAIDYNDTSGNAGISLSWKTNTSGLEIIPASASFPASTIEDFISTAQKFHRAAKFISGFKLTETEVNHFLNHNADFNNIDFKTLTTTHWERINDYVELRNKVPQSQALLTDVFSAANITSPAPTIDDLINQLNLATAWDLATITDFIKNYFGFVVNDFKNEIGLAKLAAAVSFVIKTGLSSQTIPQWALAETNFDNLNTIANLVKSTVKAKYEEEDWMKLAGDLSDKIRENQKQALISHLLTKQALIDWGVTDADGLFEYFLIDVQMGACMDTSRIVQANGAVQMFVNRCLLNLESDDGGGGAEIGVAPESIDKERWEWMKFYRVWEVNRKIFITPENWLEPEWRDDKSQFFKELESDLTQNDITDRSVETAFRNYLAKLNTVANLDISGMFQENYLDGSMKTLHVFGRTHNAPYQFFYRTCGSTFKWSAWEKVQVDIRVTENGAKSGVDLMPAVWKNRLFLFWTELIEKEQAQLIIQNKNGEATFEEIGKQHGPSAVKPKKYFEIRLAWSEYVDRKWTQKQLTKEFIKSPLDPTVSDFLLQHNIESDNSLVIWIQDQSKIFGNFHLTDIQSEIGAFTYNGGSGFSLANYSDFFMKYGQTGNLDFNGLTYLQNSTAHKLLFSTRVFDFETALKYPFFYQSNNRTYFVRSFDTRIWEHFYTPEKYPPIYIGIILEEYPTYKPPEIGPDDYYTGYEFENSIVEDATAYTRSATLMDNSNVFNSNKAMMRKNSNLNYIAKTEMEGEVLSTQKMAMNSFDISDGQMQYKLDGAYKLGNSFADVMGKNTWFAHFRTVKGLEFHTFYHPFSSNFVEVLNVFGIDGLMNADTFLNLLSDPFFYDYGAVFTNSYNPNFSEGIVRKAPTSSAYKAGEAYTYYKENICFDLYGANSCYNWELFFHVPLYIATRLSKNGRYEEARKWFHYIFDPTTDEPQGPYPSETSRYWKVLPFKTTASQSIEQWFSSIAGVDEDLNGENDVVQEWRDNPFKPFLVARNRPLAFMKNVVIKYVENLREWGDSLFRVFQREQVYEALQLYAMANHILGPLPQFVPKRGEIKSETYSSLAGKWDDFSNATVELENIFPYSSSVSVSSGSSSPAILGFGPSLYFCIPSNEKLLEHWDVIADRLYKIRHCMDIDGVKRQLALFAPPIDPAMLINAAAQGLSLGSILSDLSSPPPIYRFTFLIQKANEFCAEVKSLGSSLLSALEKKDVEELSRLRATQETMMLDLMSTIKEKQVLDAKAVKEALLKTRDSAAFRLEHYNSLMTTETIDVPVIPDIDANANSESQLPADTGLRRIPTDVDVALVDSEESTVKLISKEKGEIDDLNTARGWQIAAQAAEGLAAIAHVIPTVSGDGKPFGVGVGASWGGTQLGNALSAGGKILDFIGNFSLHSATIGSKMASYIRREQEWTLQANIAAKEIIQLDKQITSAEIKIQVAKKELSNHKQQIDDSKAVEQFLKDKFTNVELYQWMKEQLFSVYKQSFNMAYDMAKKVEKCYQYELGIEPTNFIQYGYWDNTMQGLCAGEKLQLALHQLEKSYIEENKRELELTKSISLAMLNPLALQELKSTGKCFVTIPEEIYDLDYPGHYFRRIKSLSISIPSVVGPFTTINCTLRLLKNSVRINTSMNGGAYEHNNEDGVWIDDDRFRENNVPVKAIATSTAQRDPGMFELNFRDERYLPFEGAGAISEWKIELTQDPELRLFNYSTISDLIIHVSYTAREDAGLFRDGAVAHLKDFITNAADLSTQPLMRMFSLKHEFSSEWYKFLNPTIAGSDQVLSLSLRKEHFPFFAKDRTINVKKVQVLMNTNRSGDYKMMFSVTDLASPLPPDPPDIITSSEITMPENATFDNMQMATLTADSAATVNINVEDMDVLREFTLKFRHSADVSVPQKYNQIDTDPEEITDLFLVIHYALGD